ncbi:MAG: hypothetical protein E6K74_01430 [Candidatus Eisenbacteria bacterium]|uniref:Cytochrome c domain-containing protein n=1 Tax=Eiseniibacteriota bacterium TaxID=2212470 RepID=A0A538SX90_UNCEI|nr:MAG: hypothetical protein E6K74_01430 [Candidatus Eisenbacteria bacterium]
MSHPQGCYQHEAGHRAQGSCLDGVHGARWRRGRRWRDAAIIAICALCVHVLGCSKLLTTKPAPGERFDAPLDGLDNGELGDFQAGHTQFRKAFTIAEGLGPIFNNVSCASCHSGDGRGRVDVSARMPPPVFGVGLIEALSDSVILSHEDPGDSNGDGISGRANMVTPAPYVPATEPGGGTGPRVGRFGRKASVSSLLQQTVEAYHQDIGMTSSYRPIENVNPLASHVVPGLDPAADPELANGEIEAVMQYMRMLAPPTPGEWTAQRRRGETLFASAQCASCHVPTMRTGAHEIDALANRDVTLYSDLLLHDLGDALADNRPDGSADGHEWRTAPLWGLRIAREFLNGQLFLLHDGRARSVDAAVRLHGGEAAGAVNAYLAMPPQDQAALVDFVGSR